METCVYSWDKVSDPTTTEAKACLQAVIFAEDLRFREVSVESDALTVVNKFKSEELDRSTIGNTINEIKCKIQRFIYLAFKHIPRTANGVAYRLVVWGRQFDSPRFWVEEILSEVGHLLSEDRNGG
ncbi:hypothetical protein Gotri_024029 [Gossypium trilobum]|uniref:RNase H type-1 domain-containing protein n=1 Tax=Gossypium trilobum TaxID=34281 RepID=A0A7J9DKW8_9ROSI|nr:hypothetical protein [Gossypium trilobum]